MTVSSEQAFSGTQSVKVVSAGGGYNRGFLTMDLSETPPLQDEMFGRMMIYISDENANAGDFTFLQAEGSTPKAVSGAPAGTTVMYRGRIDRNYDHIFTNYDTWIDEDADNVSDWETDCYAQPAFTETMAPAPGYIVPKNRWVCVAWHMKSRIDHLDLHMAGSDLPEVHVNGIGDGCINNETQQGMWYAPEKFERLHLGVEQYEDDALPRTMYIDDLEVSTMYMACGDKLVDHEHEHEH